MILLAQTISKNLHYLEFIKPIEDIFTMNNIEFESIHYNKIGDEEIKKADRIIISGTSLKDNEYLKNINKFKWIKKNNKPILGICSGMHIIGLIFNGKLKKQQEIGLTKIYFKKEFLGYKNELEVYELHNFFVESNKFNIYAESKKCIQAIKHKKRPVYGVLFHPEVRNKKLIINFLNV